MEKWIVRLNQGGKGARTSASWHVVIAKAPKKSNVTLRMSSSFLPEVPLRCVRVYLFSTVCGAEAEADAASRESHESFIVSQPLGVNVE